MSTDSSALSENKVCICRNSALNLTVSKQMIFFMYPGINGTHRPERGRHGFQFQRTLQASANRASSAFRAAVVLTASHFLP